ncbi:tripartite tricarboxylate transporter substrate-binding protein [Cupriavidus necator]|uniref:Bug family tripartite tricarboxylate transporter substrate binding protein n=1 Tax=Cupriavidus necator TaxID=106590 RepID=UPI003ED0A947
MMKRRTFLQSLPALAAMPASFPASVLAQAYPSHPVRIIVPVSPGSGSDVVARYMSAELTKVLGSAFVVENRLGASGIIGTDFVAKAAPDGYTLLCTYAAHYSNQWVEKTPYDAVRDFEPVARLGMSAAAADYRGQFAVPHGAGCHRGGEAQARERVLWVFRKWHHVAHGGGADEQHGRH